MTTSSDSNLIKGGARYIGFSFFSSGGGRLAILSKSNSGKWQHDAKMLIGHNGPILDLDFFPYNDSYLATCSDDATIKIWQIPEDAPLKEDITVCSSTLYGHSRKVNLIGFNDAAEGILASTSLDYTMKIWDVQKGEVKLNLTGPAEYCIGFEWGFNSDLIASTWKDKHLRVADVRSE
jgi:coronin-1B/1C/6